MKEQTAVILWDGNVKWIDIENKINILFACQIKRICIMATGVPNVVSAIPGVTIVHEPISLGSLKAAARGINYIRTSFWQDASVDVAGIFVVFSHAPASERLFERMLQLTTTFPIKNIDALATIQLVTEMESQKYILNSYGMIDSTVMTKERGHEFAGIMYIGRNCLPRFLELAANIHDFEEGLQEMIRTGLKVYGVVYECCSYNGLNSY